MTTANFTTTISVDNSAQEVFHAINNVRAWWSEEIEGKTDLLNEEWNYHYQDVHRCKLKTIELIPNKKVVWEVVDNYFSFTKDKDEWKGNKIVFEISEANRKTHLKVTQIGLVPAYECYDICENAWNTYIQKSLFGLITKGVGQPNGKEQAQTDDEKALASSSFTSTFFVNQSSEEVFSAISNVRAWWQGEISGNTQNLHDEFEYQMNDVHYSKHKIVELVSGKKVEWLVTDSKLKFSKPSEWTGTRIIFEITEINNKTQVRFTHVGLISSFECFENCSWAWGQLIQESLFSLITTGAGKPVFD